MNKLREDFEITIEAEANWTSLEVKSARVADSIENQIFAPTKMEAKKRHEAMREDCRFMAQANQ